MALSRLVFTVLLLSISCYATKVPAFIWGDLEKTSTKANPLVTTTPEQFTEILNKELAANSLTVVFIDEKLDVEDFSLKNGKGETLFPYLHRQLKNSLYLPSVQSPLHVLNRLAHPEKVHHATLTESGLSGEIEFGDAKYLFINLKDAKEDESRAELLQRHNDFMEETFTKLQDRYTNIVAIYTAHYPNLHHSRVRRQSNETATHGNDYQLDGLRFYVKNIMSVEGNTTTPLTGNLNAQTEFNNEDNTMNTTVTVGDYTFIMKFRLKAGYWFFDSVVASPGADEVEMFPNLEVYSLQGWSYRCGQSVLFKGTNNKALEFEDVQIQPYFEKTNGSQVFGETFDCVGYFSAPIWAGLLVTFLFLFITFYGLLMIMDIRTMDRFDDPKGKTITINTTE